MRRVAPILLAAAVCVTTGAQSPRAPWIPDRGDGTYTNPVLYADYSDPDAVRVGDTFYMTASSFNAVPGLPILKSRDLVNWRLIGHALQALPPADVFETPQHGKGPWAPAIRHHAGRFWIYFPEPDLGIYAVTATNPAGPWSEPALVKAGKGLIDPCPLWDEDGRVYLVHAWARSRAGFANVLTLNQLSADGLHAIDEGTVIVDGERLPGYRTLEGPKIYKRNDEYWIFAPAGGVKTGWQSVFRSKSIDGPYEARIVLEQGSTDINGPHQGAWVDTPEGDHWFLHFQDLEAYGRVVHLQPMTWRADGWPVMGVDGDGDGKGEPVRTWKKPRPAVSAAIEAPPTSDEFDGPGLGLQWQWQANPRREWMSLSASPGSLRLFAQAAPAAESIWMAPNLLLQKFPAPAFTATAALDHSHAAPGESAGLVVFGQDYAWIGLKKGEARSHLVLAVSNDARTGAAEREVASLTGRGPRVYLRVTVSAGGRCRFSTSDDNVRFIPIGEEFTAKPGVWVGAKVGLFAIAAPGSAIAGFADWAWFRVGPPQN